MIDSISLKITRTFTITRQQVIDLLSSALEGGSNYWYWNLDYTLDETSAKEVEEVSGGVFRGYWAPFSGGRMTLEIQENSAGIPYWDGEGEGWAKVEGDEPGRTWVLDLDALQRGMAIMSERYPRNFADLQSENGDANTGDVYLQCCLFGQIVFG